MATLELAKDKWARKMAGAGPRWKKKVETYGILNYPKRMAEFLGLSAIAEDKKKAYEEGVKAVSAEDFQAAVRGKEDKWATRLKEAFTPL